jgi:Na+/H+ antiporter NhaD/arsenite permease-like protein
MIPALLLFILTYALMLMFQKWRERIALISALIFVAFGLFGLYPITPLSALSAVDYNVLLMIGGTMGLVSLFIASKMPARLAELLIGRVPDVRWAVASLALFAGFISAFVDNVATVLMVAPVGLAISRRLKISPVPVLIAIAVSSNLQGAATLVGDTTSMLLGGYAGMNFPDFFWMSGRPGIFFAVELGAGASLFVLLYLFRKEKAPVTTDSVTTVEDYFPSALMLGVVALLICASFLSQPSGGFLLTLYSLRNGLICLTLCLVGLVREMLRGRSTAVCRHTLKEIDWATLLLLFSLFIIIEGIRSAGVIDAVAGLFYQLAGDRPFLLYTLLVFVSVLLSAFIDNIPYVATMLPVVQSLAAMMNGGEGMDPSVFYFGLLSGATLGGNLTPIGASANIAAIGILRKNGESVTPRDFLRIGVPFTLVAVLVGYVFIWIFWGIL